MIKLPFSLPIFTAIALVISIQNAMAQTYTPSNRTPVADGTMNTQVGGGGNNFNITGGVSKGQTLFHSFTDFSVPTNGSANFINPVTTRDIITRVTGTNFSDINGLINSNGANFFLINPNGVTFGTNARLNVGKAFMATSANSIDLVDGSGRTITFGTNGAGDAPLLSIAPNVLFDVSKLQMGGGNGQINNFGTLQTTNTSQYIGLIGGNVNLDGGKIFAPGGRVDLGGLTGAGTVTATAQGLDLGGNRANVTLSNGAVVSVRANGTLDNVRTFFGNVSAPGSSINIGANNIDILNSGFKSATEPAALDAGLEQNSGTYSVSGGDISLNATGKVTLDNSNVKNTLRTGATGNVGGIKIDAKSVELKNDALISAIISGQGNVGDIKIVSGGDVSVIDRSAIAADNIEGTGNAGNIDIKAAGNINVVGATDLSQIDFTQAAPALSQIVARTAGTGNAGKITLDAGGDISFSNSSILSSAITEIGSGNSQGIEIKNARNLNLTNQSFIGSNNFGGTGNAGNIDIKLSGNLNIIGVEDRIYQNNPSNVNLVSSISSSTGGKGDAGKITIDTPGDVMLKNRASIASNVIGTTAQGNSPGIEIKNARNLTLVNASFISSRSSKGIGNAGNIDIKTTGDINVIGLDPQSPLFTSNLNLVNNGFISYISSDISDARGDTGKITISTPGDINLSYRAQISSEIYSSTDRENGRSTSQGIEIKNARNLNLFYQSDISTSNIKSNGNAGNIDIKTSGDIKIVGADDRTFQINGAPSAFSSSISTNSSGRGNAGKISIDAGGDILLSNNGAINAVIGFDAQGNSGGIEIKKARDLVLNNGGRIATSQLRSNGNAGNIDIKNIRNLTISNLSTIDSALNDEASIGNAGDINIQATGNIKIIGVDLQSLLLPPTSRFYAGISSSTNGKGDAGKISIDTTGNIEIANQGIILSSIGETGNGNSRGIEIKNAGNLKISNDSSIFSSNLGGKGNSGNIDIKTNGNISVIGFDRQSSVFRDYPDIISGTSSISSISAGNGKAGNISIGTQRLGIQNKAQIVSAGESVSGGDIKLVLSDLLLLRNNSYINTTSKSTKPDDNGGNITINSPLIVAVTPSSGIGADAVGGAGGNVNITSQGLFGIQYVPKERQASFGGNFITASSQFGRNGEVKIDTPGTDPGRETTELPNVALDASNQISQACSATTQQNKLILAGRGGLPVNANDPLTSDVVWQDPRASASQPVASNAPTNQLPPPAVGMVFDGKGKVKLVAANVNAQRTGRQVVCPQPTNN